MPEVREVDVAADFGVTLNHFYSIVKENAGTLESDQYLQLQVTAIPMDIKETYKWFSYGNLSYFFDVRAEPKPVTENLGLLSAARFSDEYLIFISDLLSLVEFRELDGETLARIDALKTKINNNQALINAVLKRRLDDWVAYAEGSLIDRGNLTIFRHWAEGYSGTREMQDLAREQARDQALISALRVRSYESPDDQAVVDAYAAADGPGSRLRYPRFPDPEYGEEATRFNVTYMASLPDNESSLFHNRKLITTPVSLGTITTGTLGSLSDTVTRTSQASSQITTDWSHRGGGRWGPFKVSAKVSSHQAIKEDFSHLQSIAVGAKSLQALPIDATAWFRPAMFRHPLVRANRRMFERYLGETGTLLYYPTHLIIARGMNLKFSSSQAWSHDYESDFSASGSGSGRFFGFKFGGGASYSRSVREQRVERRGHDLVLDDGENIRIIGYRLAKNSSFVVDALPDVIEGLEAQFN